MSVSSSTPRLRLTLWILLATLLLVAVTDRTLLVGSTGEVVQLLGLMCIAGAALGRIWTSVFIAGFKDATLVRVGPYAALRHPLYACSMLAMLGIGLATRSIALTVVLVVAFAVVYRRAARDEDGRLAAFHGEHFEEYRRRTDAFRPRWSEYRVPETLEVRPRVLWKAFLDAGSLLGFYALLRVADLLELQGITPTWMTLP